MTNEPGQGQKARGAAAASPKEPDAPKTTAKDAQAEQEEHWVVRFHQKIDNRQPEDVHLGLNGDILIIKRMEPVALPARFLSVADETTYPTYTHVPGQERKQTGYAQSYPYDRLRQCTPEEYLKMRREGTEAVRKFLASDVQQPDGVSTAQEASRRAAAGLPV